ncbi:hypothetical protein PGTUg99_008067 [Puccinia graminis f. sp. tritici]|uniref:Uncharacterized protein n=1 Tax=Puccinia graminis f. sp. tritici TaxID=56615 RepID=A0A5B0P2G3_PUCGR|nr:hypothetical protein PGTUg99_008067 [Puccinia graminis f. sp. tritici]
MPPIIEEFTNASPPTMSWVGHMGRHPDWLKSGLQSVAQGPMFTAWMDAILKSGAKKGGVHLKTSNPTDNDEVAASNDLMAVTARRLEARAATRAAAEIPNELRDHSDGVGERRGPSGSASHTGAINTDPSPFDLEDSGDDSCDEGFQARKIIQEDLFKKYQGNIGVDPHHAVFPHPTDVNRYVILTPGNVASWARAIHTKEIGVSLTCPPARMKYYTRKGARGSERSPQRQTPQGPASSAGQMTPEMVVTMMDLYHQRAGQKRAHSPGLEASPLGVGGSDEALVDYLTFVGVPDKEETVDLLKQSGVDHYQMFAEGFMSAEELQGLGLKVGILAKLRRNVGRYERSLTSGR